MGKVDENKRHKKQELMESAFHLFTTKGLPHTSVADIVERAGLAKGTFYLYFHDKYAIQEALIQHKTQQIFHRALETSGYRQRTGLSDRLIAIVDAVLEQLQHDPALLRFINRNLSWGVFHRALDKASEEYLSALRRLMDESGEQVEQPLLLLYTIVELVGSTCHSVILEGDPVSLEEYRPCLERCIRAMVEEFRIDGAAGLSAAPQQSGTDCPALP